MSMSTFSGTMKLSRRTVVLTRYEVAGRLTLMRTLTRRALTRPCASPAARKAMRGECPRRILSADSATNSAIYSARTCISSGSLASIHAVPCRSAAVRARCCGANGSGSSDFSSAMIIVSSVRARTLTPGVHVEPPPSSSARSAA